MTENQAEIRIPSDRKATSDSKTKFKMRKNHVWLKKIVIEV